MTASGVVKMFVDGAPAEFIPLGEWVREHSVYNRLKQKPFFKSYRALRVFRMWRAAARAQHFEKVLMVDRTLSRLVADLKKGEAHLKRELEELDLELINGCGSTSTNPASKNLIKLKQEKLEKTKELRIKLTQQTAPKSLIKLKQEKLEKTKELRVAQQNVGLLCNMVRLADYMLVESALDMLATTVDSFHQTMNSSPVITVQLSFAESAEDMRATAVDSFHQTMNSSPVITVQLSFAEAGMEFYAKEEETKETGMEFYAKEEETKEVLTTEVIDALLQMMRGFPRILPNEAYSTLFTEKPRGPEMTVLIMGFKPLQKARIACGHAINKSYEHAREQVARYEELRVINNFCLSFDIPGYAKQQRDILQFRRDMAMIRCWMDDLNALRAGEDVGMLHVSCTELQVLLLLGTLEQVLLLGTLEQVLLLGTLEQVLAPRAPSEACDGGQCLLLGTLEQVLLLGTLEQVLLLGTLEQVLLLGTLEQVLLLGTLEQVLLLGTLEQVLLLGTLEQVLLLGTLEQVLCMLGTLEQVLLISAPFRAVTRVLESSVIAVTTDMGPLTPTELDRVRRMVLGIQVTPS
eukprot:gene26384-17477_t